jgi:hypothetical protein
MKKQTYEHWSKIVSLPSYSHFSSPNFGLKKTSFPNLYIPVDENQLNLKKACMRVTQWVFNFSIGPGTFPGFFKLYGLNVEQYDV